MKDKTQRPGARRNRQTSAKQKSIYGGLAIRKLIAHAACDKRIGLAGLRVLCVLQSFADDNYGCWPSMTTVAEELGVTRQAVQQALLKLGELGYVRSRRRKRDDGGEDSKIYRLNIEIAFENGGPQQAQELAEDASAGDCGGEQDPELARRDHLEETIEERGSAPSETDPLLSNEEIKSTNEKPFTGSDHSPIATGVISSGYTQSKDYSFGIPRRWATTDCKERERSSHSRGRAAHMQIQAELLARGDGTYEKALELERRVWFKAEDQEIRDAGAGVKYIDAALAEKSRSKL